MRSETVHETPTPILQLQKPKFCLAADFARPVIDRQLIKSNPFRPFAESDLSVSDADKLAVR